MPPEETHLRENLTYLSRSHASLADAIEKSAPNLSLAFRNAKNGESVPIFRSSVGEQPLHSLVDPCREAERLLRSVGNGGYLVCLGLGGGFAAASFLRQPQASGLLIIEKDPSTLRRLLGGLSLSSVLSDERLRLTTGLESIKSTMRSTYLPVLCGNLISYAVRPWCMAEKEFFDAAAEEVRQAAEEIRADYGVQAVFGKRWFSNMLLNLPVAGKASMRRIPVAALAHVTAAGPSLEEDLVELSRRADGSIIIATDTSLPALRKSGVQPEIVVSLDCQAYSYHHFLGGFPADGSLFFDLASPPSLVRQCAASSFFYTSAHPFARYVSANWKVFPIVDTTGGNVTHAAVSLAGALGIARVRVHGGDFSYPRAKPYARGTYLYDYFMERENRLAPLESRLTGFVLGSASLTVERVGSATRYSTPVLQDYKKRLQQLARQSLLPRTFDCFPAPRTWLDFLESYTEAIRQLPIPSTPQQRSFEALSSQQKELWATLLPVCACILRETQGTASPDSCLAMSRQWALGHAERMLLAPAHGL